MINYYNKIKENPKVTQCMIVTKVGVGYVVRWCYQCGNPLNARRAKHREEVFAFVVKLCYNKYIKKINKGESKTMLKMSVEELSALNLVLQFMTVSELLNAAMKGFVENEDAILKDKEKSDLCWKVLKTLQQSRRP